MGLPKGFITYPCEDLRSSMSSANEASLAITKDVVVLSRVLDRKEPRRVQIPNGLISCFVVSGRRVLRELCWQWVGFDGGLGHDRLLGKCPW